MVVSISGVDLGGAPGACAPPSGVKVTCAYIPTRQENRAYFPGCAYEPLR